MVGKLAAREKGSSVERKRWSVVGRRRRRRDGGILCMCCFFVWCESFVQRGGNEGKKKRKNRSLQKENFCSKLILSLSANLIFDFVTVVNHHINKIY